MQAADEQATHENEVLSRLQMEGEEWKFHSRTFQFPSGKVVIFCSFILTERGIFGLSQREQFSFRKSG